MKIDRGEGGKAYKVKRRVMELRKNIEKNQSHNQMILTLMKVEMQA